MFTVEEFFVIRDLHHQGLNISQISRKTGHHRNKVRKYLTAQTVPSPAPRRVRPSKLDPFKEYIQQRISEYPLSAPRTCQEIQEMRFDGKCTIVKDYLRMIRPQTPVPAVFRYETRPGVQAQVDWGECGHLDIVNVGLLFPNRVGISFPTPLKVIVNHLLNIWKPRICWHLLISP
ncbi:hypothetical protein DSECCO2_607220 [anaerobic digester metagenome]